MALASSLWIAGAAQPAQRSKGGDLTFALVSDLHGEHPRTFAPHERFKVYVTCPAAFARVLGVLVFQDHARFEPLARGAIRCGENLAVWRGAFTLDGDDPAEVCVVWGAALARATSEAAVGSDGICQKLLPRR